MFGSNYSTKIPQFLNSSHPLGCRVPDELVNLQTQPDVQAVCNNPLGQLLRIEEALRGVATAGRLLPKCGRKNHRHPTPFEAVHTQELAGEVVVFAAGEHEFDFIMGGERLKVFVAEGAIL